MKTRGKSSSTKDSAEEYRDTDSEFDSSDEDESVTGVVELEEEEEKDGKKVESLLSEAGKTQFLKDIESVGGPWSCTKGNRRFAQICDRNQALYGKKGSRDRRVAQNLVTYWKTKATAAKYVEELHKRDITVSDSTRAKLQQELSATGTGPTALPLPAAVASPPSVPNSQQRKVVSTAGKQSSQKKKSATHSSQKKSATPGHSSQKKSSTSQKQTTTSSSPRELFPDSTMQNSKQGIANDPNNPRLPLRYQNHETCM